VSRTGILEAGVRRLSAVNGPTDHAVVRLSCHSTYTAARRHLYAAPAAIVPQASLFAGHASLTAVA